jgi:hypothetical protein
MQYSTALLTLLGEPYLGLAPQFPAEHASVRSSCEYLALAMKLFAVSQAQVGGGLGQVS